MADEVRTLPDRWVEFRGFPGWEDHIIGVQAYLRRGDAVVTGLTVRAISDSAPGLTGQRLRNLPVLAMGREALIYLPREPDDITDSPSVQEVLAELSPEQLEEVERQLSRGPKTRASVPLDDFVAAWRSALSDPTRRTGVREAVCTALGISTRTYDRYRKQAEAVPGLAPTREGDQR